MRRIKAKESGGVVVAYLSRFGRTAGQTILHVNEINSLGAAFITADGKYDTSTKEGRAWVGFMSVLAEMEIDRISENWEYAVERAIGQGRYVAGAIPTGYLKGDDGRLSPDPKVAPIIEELFRLRAEEGWSWTRLADWLTAQGVRPNTADMADRMKEKEWTRWTRQSVRGLIMNPAYKGWAKQVGDEQDRIDGKTKRTMNVVNEAAHEPIVDEWLWQQAQGSGEVPARNGEMSSQSILRGLCYCDECGHRMIITGRFNKSVGKRMPFYYCQGRYSTGDCALRPAIDLHKVDEYVEGIFLEYVAQRSKTLQIVESENATRLAELEDEVVKTEARFVQYKDNEDQLVDALGGMPQYLAELKERRLAWESAQAELAAERRKQQQADDLLSGSLAEDWKRLSNEAKRDILAGYIDEVRVKSSEGRRGRHALPAAQRIEIVWNESVA
jgi:site-specific DNA recombinase